MSPLEKLTKKQLIEKINQLEKELAETQKSRDNFCCHASLFWELATSCIKITDYFDTEYLSDYLTEEELKNLIEGDDIW